MRKILLTMMSLTFLASIAWAQTRSLSGTVVGDNGVPLVGASVTQKNSTKGTVTDANGKFTISLPTGKVSLVINSVGYTAQELAITNQNEVRVQLVTENKSLEEVVVVGYGSVRKKDLTGAVGSISTKDIVRTNPANATQALQGQVTGVVVTKSSNKPGQAFSIDIRGQNTITGATEPLVVVDGVIGARLRDINPQDIQSIDVLKDASSTAIYGARGANGVIIITSKKGIAGKPKVTLDSYFGSKRPGNFKATLMNAQQFYKATVDDAVLNGGRAATFTSSELAMINSGKSTDWVDEVTQPGITANTTVAVTGGNAGTTYRFSGGYIQEDGNIPVTSFKKYSLNASLDSRLNNWLRVGFTAYINYSTTPQGSLEVLRSAYRVRPTGVVNYADIVNPGDGKDLAIGPYNGLAVWMGINDTQVTNPLLDADPTIYQNTTTFSNQMGNGFVEVGLAKGLTFKSTFSASTIDERFGEFRNTLSKAMGLNPPRANSEYRNTSTFTLDNQLSYKLTKGKHKLNATALQSAYKNTYETYSIAAQRLPYESLWYNLGTAEQVTAASTFVRQQIESYMGRFNYTFNEKYLLTLTGRADGASQLAPENRWAFFPSGAFAWQAGDEDFIRDLNVFSNLKLRVSYGEVGNANVAAYSTQAGLLTTNYSFGATAFGGFAPSAIGNKDLKWERSQELNLGLNMGFFNNRITTTVEVYKRNTKDLILNQTLPTSTGFSTVTTNVGKVSNKGIEIMINSRNIETKNFTWATNINFSKNINRIESLANGIDAIIGSKLFVGKPVRSHYDYKFAGIWQIEDSAMAATYKQLPGSVRVEDTNNDGVISNSTGKDDRVWLGSQLPNFILGMTNRFTYKNFDMSFLLYYRNGTMYYNDMLRGTMAEYTNNRYNKIMMNYWTRNNPTNDFYGPGVPQPFRNARSYEDATFLRLSDITVGYNVPASVLKNKIERIRVYGQIINAGVFTNYNGLDPEFNRGAYIDDVPNITYAVGLNIGF
jgi:TonB-dependent starch-binding outer membrane protein SusC